MWRLVEIKFQINFKFFINGQRQPAVIFLSLFVDTVDYCLFFSVLLLLLLLFVVIVIMCFLFELFSFCPATKLLVEKFRFEKNNSAIAIRFPPIIIVLSYVIR